MSKKKRPSKGAHSFVRTDPEMKRTLVEVASELQKTATAIQEVKGSISSNSQSFGTFIVSLGVAGMSLKKAIPVTIRPDGDEFIASFLDANISCGAASIQEAVSDLQSLIADFFDDLEQEPDDKLAPAMLRTKKVLLEIVCRS
jgi:hypothetical protein